MAWKSKAAKRAYEVRYMRAHPEKRWAKAHPERKRTAERRRHLRKAYGLTPEQFATILAFQCGRCAACRTAVPGGKGNSWHVDHDHQTGVVRGLLCNACNRACGLLGDDAQRLEALAQYLRFPPTSLLHLQS